MFKLKGLSMSYIGFTTPLPLPTLKKLATGSTQKGPFFRNVVASCKRGEGRGLHFLFSLKTLCGDFISPRRLFSWRKTDYNKFAQREVKGTSA
jgi:hypothetical protein